MPSLQSLPVEVLGIVAKRVRDDHRRHPLRPAWLCDRDAMALGATCRLGRDAVKLVTKSRVNRHEYHWSHWQYKQAADTFLLSRAQLGSLQHTVRGGYKVYREDDLVRLATEVWGTPEALDAASEQRAARLGCQAEHRRAAREAGEAARAHARESRLRDVNAFVARDGYVLEAWQQDELDRYVQDGTLSIINNSPASPHQFYERLRVQRFKKMSDWEDLEDVLKAMQRVSRLKLQKSRIPPGAVVMPHLAMQRFLRRHPELGPDAAEIPAIFKHVAAEIHENPTNPLIVAMRV